MTNAEKEFWRQFGASVLRKLLVIAGTFLASKGWITADQADGLTTAAVVEFVLSILLIVGASIWSWAKINFIVAFGRQARRSNADTPIGVITTETLEKSPATFISSV